MKPRCLVISLIRNYIGCVIANHGRFIRGVAISIILYQTSNAVLHWHAREITIQTDSPKSIQGEGEIWGTKPISIKVIPDAMRVLVPGAKF